MKTRNDQISDLRFQSDEKKLSATNRLFKTFVSTLDYSGITQLILSEYNKYLDVTSKEFKKLLLLCCKYNYYVLLKRLINLDIECKINIHFENEAIWRESLTFSNINCAKFLLSLEKDYGQINIHTNDDFGLWECLHDNINKKCEKYIQMGKFLLSLEETHGSYDWIGDNYSLLIMLIASKLYTIYKNPEYQLNEKLLTDIINANIHENDDTDHEDTVYAYTHISYMVRGLLETNMYYLSIVLDKISMFQNPVVKQAVWFYLIHECLDTHVTQSKIWPFAFQHGLTPDILKQIIHQNDNDIFRRCKKNKRIVIQLVCDYLNYDYDWSYILSYMKYDTEMYELAMTFVATKKMFTREMHESDMFDTNVFGIIESYMIPDLYST